ELMTRIYDCLYPHLIEMYEHHARSTDVDGDHGSLELIGSALPVIRDERREGLALLAFGERAAARKALRFCADLWSRRRDGDALALEHAMWTPLDRAPGAVRPEGSRFPPVGSLGLLPRDPMSNPRDIAMLLHKELDEEFTTLELMARNSYEHPSMPWNFHRDMA